MKIVKSRVKAKEVAEKFTIVTTKWVATNYKLFSAFISNIDKSVERTEIDEGKLFVDESEIQPWKAKSESPVKIGDIVQVDVEENDKKFVKAESEKNRDNQDDKGKDNADLMKSSTGSA